MFTHSRNSLKFRKFEKSEKIVVTISTKQGKIAGKNVQVKNELTENGCFSFQGIPYAKCNRFQKPVAYGPWDGVFDGTGKTPKQVQYHEILENFDKIDGITVFPENSREIFDQTPTADGELHLAVYTPENFEKSALKPVMLWVTVKT